VILAMFLLQAGLLFAQAAATDLPAVERGAALYQQRCAVPFCHGPAGTSGRAPALAGRDYDLEELRRMIAQGIPSRGMPAFQQQLGDQGVNAVLAYVRSLRPIAPAPPPVTTAPQIRLSAQGTSGRDLFFDSSRLPGCSDCHAVGEMGALVAGKLNSSISTEAIRNVRPEHVSTAHSQDHPEFPAIIFQVTSDTMRVFDLSTPLPVLRTFSKSRLALREGAAWDHQRVVRRYSPAELESIVSYIREAAQSADNGHHRH
jgi:mono/diheme cytochrome c family protein